MAAGFTITGLLDGASRTRGRYPVSEIAVADIADHPANAAYSMDPTGIAELAESIRADGLTDLPLVRKVGDGSWQMVSGHRRKAAYALLAKDDPAYERMPCRVIEGIDDERAVTLLHAANYFTRALTVTERAAATEALRGDAVRLRSEDPSLSGMRVDDVKAAIIERQTGRKVSGKTIAREERLARRIAEDLSPEWAAEADRGNLSAEAVRSLAGMPKERQAEMHAAMEPWRRTKRELSDYVRSEGKAQAGPDGRIAKAARLVADFLDSPPDNPSAADLSLLREMALMTAPYADAGTDARKRRRRLQARNPASSLWRPTSRRASIALGDRAASDPSCRGPFGSPLSRGPVPEAAPEPGRRLRGSPAPLERRARRAAGPRKGIRHGRGSRRRQRQGAPRHVPHGGRRLRRALRAVRACRPQQVGVPALPRSHTAVDGGQRGRRAPHTRGPQSPVGDVARAHEVGLPLQPGRARDEPHQLPRPPRARRPRPRRG
ncbi:putative transcriptional regulator [Bifidobacterium adolescentis JCM 15918]|uniref:Putative transcriptional regulator n=1 Tax=Bifidobacterium adolescentis JCM 15918 TaxID=1437612 RepID=A0A087DSU4_BIFAD|nr:putative transcriptional regulator [Bifidobacterium adolescentis JCM 15918]